MEPSVMHPKPQIREALSSLMSTEHLSSGYFPVYNGDAFEDCNRVDSPENYSDDFRQVSPETVLKLKLYYTIAIFKELFDAVIHIDDVIGKIDTNLKKLKRNQYRLTQYVLEGY